MNRSTTGTPRVTLTRLCSGSNRACRSVGVSSCAAASRGPCSYVQGGTLLSARGSIHVQSDAHAVGALASLNYCTLSIGIILAGCVFTSSGCIRGADHTVKTDQEPDPKAAGEHTQKPDASGDRRAEDIESLRTEIPQSVMLYDLRIRERAGLWTSVSPLDQNELQSASRVALDPRRFGEFLNSASPTPRSPTWKGGAYVVKAIYSGTREVLFAVGDIGGCVSSLGVMGVHYVISESQREQWREFIFEPLIDLRRQHRKRGI